MVNTQEICVELVNVSNHSHWYIAICIYTYIMVPPELSSAWSLSLCLFHSWAYLMKLVSIPDLMDMNLSKLQETVKDREGWHAVVHGVAKSRTWLSNWTTTITCKFWPLPQWGSLSYIIVSQQWTKLQGSEATRWSCSNSLHKKTDWNDSLVINSKN